MTTPDTTDDERVEHLPLLKPPMTTPDTTALRAQADASDRRSDTFVVVRNDTVRALCDAADEVERLRALNAATYRDHLVQIGRAEAERDAYRDALAALVAGLWALCDDPNYLLDDLPIATIRALLPRRAPEETP